jgi:hypothetical protein
MKGTFDYILLALNILHGKVKGITKEQESNDNETYNGPLYTSPPFYPSPWMTGQGEWADAYAKAKDFVSQLTLLEKVNLTTGVGWEGEQCVGQVSFPKSHPF